MASWTFARIVAVTAIVSATAPAHAQRGLLSWDEYAPRGSNCRSFRATGSGELRSAEGGIRPPAPDIEAAVARYGEPGLLRVLADRDRVELRNLEPPDDEEAAALARAFPPEQVKLFYALRMLNGLAAEPLSPERRKQMALESVRRRHKLTGTPDTPPELDAAIARLLPPFVGLPQLPHLRAGGNRVSAAAHHGGVDLRQHREAADGRRLGHAHP